MIINMQSPRNSSLHGGPAVFTERLIGELESRGMYSENDYDTWMNLSFRPVPGNVLTHHPRPRIVVRFDGTWNMAAWPWWGRRPGLATPINTSVYRYMNRILVRNVRLADAFVFQSEFSREMVERLIGGIPAKPYSVIFNGVDLQKFHPEAGRDTCPTLRILVSHKHWAVKRSWMIPRILSSLIEVYDGAVEVRVLGGDVSNPIPMALSPLEKFRLETDKILRSIDAQSGEAELSVDFIGHVAHEHLPDQYRWADMMLNLSFADPCPNVVVEALASGLPVIGPASGGLAELVGDAGDWLVDSGEDPYLLYNPYVYSSFPGIDIQKYVRCILDVKKDLFRQRRFARQRAEAVLNMDQILNYYVDAMRE